MEQDIDASAYFTNQPKAKNLLKRNLSSRGTVQGKGKNVKVTDHWLGEKSDDGDSKITPRSRGKVRHSNRFQI